MPKITQDLIDLIKSKVDIVDVISDRVVLQKKGNEFKGLCPFHSEKTPSFSVNQEKQLYHCYGCGESGDLITFAMQTESLSFNDAIIAIASKAQIEIPEEDSEYAKKLKADNDLKQKMYDINAIALEFFCQSLKDSKGLDYLVNRQVANESIAKFRLGYADAKWESLYRHLVDRKVDIAIALKLGLIAQKNDKYYDIYRDRLMVPIFDSCDRVIGFGGRNLDVSQKTAKYVNSQDSLVFKKSAVLYGINFAKKQIKDLNYALITEGYFDVINLHSLGFDNAIASMGTALNSDAIKQIAKLTNKVILNFDNDDAGIKAAERAIESNIDLLACDRLDIRVLFFDKIKDAGELTQCDRDILKTKIDNAPTWIEWLIMRSHLDRDLNNPVDFKAVFDRMSEILNQIKQNSQFGFYLAKCADILGQGNYAKTNIYISSLRSQTYKSTQSQPIAQRQQETDAVKRAEYLLLISSDAIGKTVAYRGFKFSPYEEIYDVMRSHKQDWRSHIQTLDFSDETNQALYSVLNPSQFDLNLLKEPMQLLNDSVVYLKRHRQISQMRSDLPLEDLCKLLA